MPYKLIGHIPCGTEACTTATHSSSECNSVDGNINVDLTPVAKESTLLTESEAIKKAIENLDLSSVESKVEEESQAIQGKIDNIDLTPIENKVDEGVSTLSAKIDNIKLPEIDTTELAKQGSNQEATNSKILEEVQKIPNLKNIYSARFEKNDDNINTYTMILPIIAGVEGDTIIL